MRYYPEPGQPANIDKEYTCGHCGQAHLNDAEYAEMLRAEFGAELCPLCRNFYSAQMEHLKSTAPAGMSEEQLQAEFIRRVTGQAGR
jgi:ribosomal protein L44E